MVPAPFLRPNPRLSQAIRLHEFQCRRLAVRIKPIPYSYLGAVRPYTAPPGPRAAHPRAGSGRMHSTLVMVGLFSASLVYSAFRPAQSDAASLTPPPLEAYTPTELGTILAQLLDPTSSIAYESKPTSALLLSWAVLKMCQLPFLVDIAPGIIAAAQKVGLEGPLFWVIKRTFFAQFCGGETAEECMDRMEALRAHGIGSILDLSIEADLETANDTVDDKDRSPQSISAHQNALADRVAKLTEQCLDTACKQPGSFAAIKLTALLPTSFLVALTEACNWGRQEFVKAGGHDWVNEQDSEGKIDYAATRRMLSQLPALSRLASEQADTITLDLFRQADTDKDGRIDWIDFQRTFSPMNPEALWLYAATLTEANEFSTGPTLSPVHIEDYHLAVRRLEHLAQKAKEVSVRLMVDAEQSYFQPGIDCMFGYLSSRFNHAHDSEPEAVVFNTYQMYTIAALPRLVTDIERARRENVAFGAKLVRGAYMESERKRAKELGYPDPIHPDIASTHKAYNTAVQYMLNIVRERNAALASDETKVRPPVFAFLATHNIESIRLALKTMQAPEDSMDLTIPPTTPYVLFGQLLGMCDTASFSLGRGGYSVYKYVPYGAIDEVMPYLLRRAQENRGVFTAPASPDKVVLARKTVLGGELTEIMRRVKRTFGFTPYQPSFNAATSNSYE
ncbi:hypothetical protein BZG36_03494 [Bifiguratus adelaidae]|uniref:Proline dehydrogenase n=1 Tax=Bifiguratus adelaidae TaxID=1938954 RepID=A0A261XZL4_9FUNG|nr:hypothetical protein BZG36_03494 [Bifiguratus adelaidae]